MTATYVPLTSRALGWLRRIARRATAVLAAIGAVLLVSGALLLASPASYATGSGAGGTRQPQCGCSSPSGSPSPSTSPSASSSPSASASASVSATVSASTSASVSPSSGSSQSPSSGASHKKHHSTKTPGTVAALPTAVEAGLASTTPAPAHSGAAVGLMGAGAVLLAVSGWLTLWRRPRGAHES